MEIEIENGTIEIDEESLIEGVLNSGRLNDEIDYVLNNRLDYDDIRQNIEYDILSNVHDHIDTETLFVNVSDHVDFYYNTGQLDFDEIREMIEDDILAGIEMYLDYDSILQEINRRQIPELMETIGVLNDEVRRLEIVQGEQHRMMLEVMSRIEELEMSVWSRIVRYVRSWF